MSETALYRFDLIEDYPCFTQKNLLLLDALIRYNSDYSVTEDVSHPDYLESYAGILKRDRENFFNFESDKNLYKVVRSIDKINSTHLQSEGSSKKVKPHQGIIKTVDKIKSIRGLRDRLYTGDPAVVHEIASAVETKYNFSFATKFCTFVCSCVWGDESKYCIYDEVVQSILPLYIHRYVGAKEAEKYYKIVNIGRSTQRVESTVCLLKDRNRENGYSEYRKIISNIINGIEQKDGICVSYSQFDQLLWYYFKGSKKRIQEALNTLLPK